MLKWYQMILKKRGDIFRKEHIMSINTLKHMKHTKEDNFIVIVSLHEPEKKIKKLFL